MLVSIHSSSFNLEIDPEKGLFNLAPASSALPGLRGCRLSLTLRRLTRKQPIPLDSWVIIEGAGDPSSGSPHGPLLHLKAKQVIADPDIVVEDFTVTNQVRFPLSRLFPRTARPCWPFTRLRFRVNPPIWGAACTSPRGLRWLAGREVRGKFWLP